MVTISGVILPSVTVRTAIVAGTMNDLYAWPGFRKKKHPIAYLVDRLVEVAEQDRVHRFREVGQKLLKWKLRASPRGMGHANPDAFDLQDLGVRQGSSQIGWVGVAVDYHGVARFASHTVHDVLPNDVAAVDGDVGLPHGGANVRMDFVPAVDVGIGDYYYSGWHLLGDLRGISADRI